jgi:hypothetical protein
MVRTGSHDVIAVGSGIAGASVAGLWLRAGLCTGPILIEDQGNSLEGSGVQ